MSMIHIRLDETTREQLQSLRRDELPPRARDRLEMVCLSDAGWPAARIAGHLGYDYRTVLRALHDFDRHGSAALFPRRRGPAPDLGRRDRLTALLRDLVGQDRTWTAAQLAEALHDRGVHIGPRQVRRYLKHLRAGYRRTASSVKHKQDPAKAVRAAVVLGNLRAKAEAGELELNYLDESGFAPSLPCGYSWALPGQRKRVPHEYPQGRRVNVLAAYRPDGGAPWLGSQAFERTLKSEDLLAYLRALPAVAVPRVVVLDNASLHVSKAVKAERRGLAGRGIYLYYLPPYSPELNRIEPVFRQVKYQEIPVRSYTSKPALREAVEQGFSSYAGRLAQKKSGQQLRPAA
jgi:putative transposase